MSQQASCTSYSKKRLPDAMVNLRYWGLLCLLVVCIGAGVIGFHTPLVMGTTVGSLLFLMLFAIHQVALTRRLSNRTAERISQEKSDFLAIVSHELRNPLTSIMSFSEILLMYEEEDLETQREFLEIIHQECSRLKRLIDDAGDLSKMENHQIEWRKAPCDLSLLAETARNLMHQQIQSAGLLLEVDVAWNLPQVVCDSDRIMQVLINLVSNALKFTERGKVRIGATLVDQSIIMSVSDTGIGIAEGDHGIIFERYQQLENGVEKAHGSRGIGLSLCRKIVESHGGRLWVHSNVGKGSTFYFSLPLGEAQAVEANIQGADARVEPAVESKDSLAWDSLTQDD